MAEAELGRLVGAEPGTFLELTANFDLPDVPAPPLNELVVTSGFTIGKEQSLYPAGIVIGEVSRFVPATNDLEAFILVRPAVDFSEIRYVVVLTRSGA